MESTESPETASRSRVVRSLVLYPLSHLAVEIYGSLLNILWPVLAGKFGLTYTAVGALSMISRVTTTLPQLGFARVSDQRGPKWLAVIGLAWMAVGISTIGLAPSVMVLAILLFFAPLGSAAFHPAGTGQVSRVLPKQRGLAIGLFMIGGTLGSSIGPKVGAWLVQGRGIAATPLLIPLGLALAALMAFILPSNLRSTARSASARTVQRASPVPTAIIVIMLVQISQGWLELGVQSYLPLLMTARGDPLDQAATALTLFSLLGAVGAFVGGVLSDRFPRWRVLGLVVLCTPPIYLATILVRGPLALVAPAVLGLVTAMSHPATVSMAQELMPDQLALASSLSMGISWVIAGLGALLTGILADWIGMQSALLLNAALPAVGIACVVVLRRRAKRVEAPILQSAFVEAPRG